MSSTLEKVEQPKSTPSAKEVAIGGMNLAASWYIAMQSKNLGKKPKTIELFGQPLVAWRDNKGQPVIMGRYCSHMGASLAIGEVVDGCIRCPYHHWRYNGSGQCVSVPEIENIPPTARQATYVTVERYGYIWVWYGSQTPLVPLPEFSSAEAHKYKYIPLRFAWNAKTAVLSVSETSYDHYHVLTLHGHKAFGLIQVTLLDDPYSEPPGDLPIQREGWFGTLTEFPIKKAVSMTTRVDGWPGGNIITTFLHGKEKLKVLLWTTPIAENQTIVHVLVTIKKTGNFLLDIFNYLLFGWQSRVTTAEDIAVWDTLKPHVNGAYVKHDRGILKFREFYQRWVDKAEA
jgi:aminopyrrolnitrin oxygenase